jgi:hypothetical protein
MDYMAAIRQEIGRSGEYPFSCGLIAVDIANLFLRQYEDPGNPQVVGLHGQPMDFMGNTTPLVPRAFEGRVRWGAHLVCVEGDLAYDPITAEPTPFETYLRETFTVRPERGRAFKGRELEGLIAQRALIAQDIRQNAPRGIVTDVEQLGQPKQ